MAGQAGFSLLEMMMAVVVLIIGLVGVAQLVPASLLLNSGNRTNSSALVLAQRQMDLLVNQPLTATSFNDLQGNACFCSLGDAARQNVLVGSPVLVSNDRPVIDFSQPAMPGYTYPALYIDPNDPTRAQWDVRWAVITQSVGPIVTSKRFIVGARQVGGIGFVLPVTLDTVVAK
ncbi:MAG TPA: prepilin-type N-terminal cleavage/methylation domain-containing protein [Candidatus Dormibacteraeota bacterium]|nr:prepilin-type N-terminal cleavage/methylation domain-containing protein [Candidatus Dormibacteraeota bacterium]